jgi:uncharacterized protein (TIGR03435 family)
MSIVAATTLCGAAILLTSAELSTNAAQQPAFDVVSVKPNVSGDERSASYVQPGGRYTASNATVRMLIKTAYGVHDDQIVGGPEWIDTARFDLTAKAADTTPSATAFRDLARLMLRRALEDRFNLALARDRREIPVYALVISRSDGRLGSQLVRSDSRTCDGPWTSVPIAPGLPEPNPASPCNSGFSRSGHVAARAVEFSTLVTQISGWADRLVVDRTGLSGRFDWDLQWTQAALSTAATDSPGVSLATAIQEQLGLKFESRREPTDVLVVARVERPMPD